MLKKGKTGKLEYQIAFEFRSLKWFVLEVIMFSIKIHREIITYKRKTQLIRQ